MIVYLFMVTMLVSSIIVVECATACNNMTAESCPLLLCDSIKIYPHGKINFAYLLIINKHSCKKILSRSKSNSQSGI